MSTLTLLGAGTFGTLTGWQMSGYRSLRMTGDRSRWRTVRPLGCALAGGLSAGIALHLGSTWAVPAYCVFTAAIVIGSLVDLVELRIPRPLIVRAAVIGATLLAGASAATHRWVGLGDAAACGATMFLLFFGLHLISPEGLGFGDVRMAGVSGEFLGWLGLRDAFAGLTIAFVLAGLTAGFLLISRRVTRSSRIPLGPFIAAGALIAILTS